MTYPKDVRRLHARPQHHVITAAGPCITGVVQQIFDNIQIARRQAQAREIEIDPAGLLIIRIEIHDHQDYILQIARGF